MELELIANQYEEGLLILKFVPTNFNNRSPKVSNAGTTCTMSLIMSHSSSQHYAIHAPNDPYKVPQSYLNRFNLSLNQISVIYWLHWMSLSPMVMMGSRPEC